MTDLARHGNKSIKKHNLISRNYLLEFGSFNIVFLLCNCIDFLSKENRWILCMIIIIIIIIQQYVVVFVLFVKKSDTLRTKIDKNRICSSFKYKFIICCISKISFIPKIILNK